MFIYLHYLSSPIGALISPTQDYILPILLIAYLQCLDYSLIHSRLLSQLSTMCGLPKPRDIKQPFYYAHRFGQDPAGIACFCLTMSRTSVRKTRVVGGDSKHWTRAVVHFQQVFLKPMSRAWAVMVWRLDSAESPAWQPQDCQILYTAA